MSDVQKHEKKIFRAALQLKDQAERRAYIDEACAVDPALKARIKALLRAHESKGDFLDGLIVRPATTLDVSPLTAEPGEVIGRYKLLEKIGEGGFGVVYMAEQAEPISRRVALKIIKLGMDTKEVIARFEAERQALAMMEHPNIAKVLDAGATDTGRPYFVMELVKGIPLTEYCDSNSLDTHQRLALFIDVCKAVQHAHQKGIIHRDLKPSNVMITLHDGKPVPKVIDFGIAKATGQRLTEKTLFTRFAQMVGTPAYMSPEQAEYSGLDIDTRSDIYSLGVLLYELLTGVTPFDAETLRNAGHAEMTRIIREEDPPRPSTRLTQLQVQQSGQIENPKSKISNDLDWIVMKTLEKDRARRYETAHALVEDIERHLRNEPISAAPPGTVYRIQKFLRRHRVQVVTCSAVVLMVLGLLLAGSAYLRFRTERMRSDHLRSIARVEDLITSADYQEAQSEVESILSSRFVGAEAQLLNARILLEIQDPEASIKQLHQLLNESPQIAANAHFLLARIYLEYTDGSPHLKDKAEIHLQQGEQLLPRTAEAYVLRAIIAQTVQGTLGWLSDALQLDASHDGARRTRALSYYALGEYRDMETDASVMIGSQPQNPAGYSLRAMARRELAEATGDSGVLSKALADHNRSLSLSAARDGRRAEFHDQRHQTLVQMGRYDNALADIQSCQELEPREPKHHFSLFCMRLALGQYDEAQAQYDRIVSSKLMNRMRLDSLAAKYVSDSLHSGRSWYAQDRAPQGKAFKRMHEAAGQYRQLAQRARRVVAEGFHPSFSPDGTALAYSRGMLGASGIEILHLDTGKTRLLTVPGKDPAWSSDGQYILYVRDRQFLSMQDLTLLAEGRHQPFEQEEIWVIRADDTERPRFLAKGGWPNWSGDSKRLYYHSRLDNMVYSISMDTENAKPEAVFACKARYPVVSPDEKFIAFVEERTGTLTIVDLADKSVAATWLGPKLRGATFICWSADGKRLAIGSYLQGGLRIYDTDTQEATKIVDGSFAWCGWSTPDMNHMAIERVYGTSHHEIWVSDALEDGVPKATRTNLDTPE
jgi:serine/threonine protein kinase